MSGFHLLSTTYPKHWVTGVGLHLFARSTPTRFRLWKLRKRSVGWKQLTLVPSSLSGMKWALPCLGVGFASGLSTTGMPSAELPWALLFFNVGVELGQLTFVFLVLWLIRSFRILEIHWPRWAQMVPGYAVGSLGAFWTIQRTFMLLRSLS